MDISSALSSLPAIIGMLPMLLQVSQLVFSLFYIWFFGTLSMRGFRGKKPAMLRFPGILLMGALNLVAAAAFAGFIPFLGEGLFRFLQLDMLAAGIIVSIVLALALSLLTHEKSALRPEEVAEKLRLKVRGLQEMLMKKEGHMSEKEARQKAEEALKGYKASSAKLVGSEYQVKLSCGKDEATVVIDAWDGEVVSTIRHKSAVSLMLKDPKKVAGLAIIIAVAIASAVFFEGFPDPAADMASLIGMTPEELSDMAGAAAGSGAFDNGFPGSNTPEGCISYAVFMDYYRQLTDRQYLLDHVYEDDETSQVVGAGCGAPQVMMKIDHEGHELVIAITENGRVAYLTDGTFCMCIETGASAG
ncbi:MAG: PepSY domain-containing protein [Candidatus Aenigmatarchaeota archaeon]